MPDGESCHVPPVVHPLSGYKARVLKRLDPYLFFAEDLLRQPPITVEVGSFTGRHCRLIYEAYHGTVIVYEAGRATFATLKKALGSHPIIAHNKAVTGRVGTATFYEYRDLPAANSIFDRQHKSGQAYAVDTVGIERILEENEIPHIDALFSNSEGAELGMLEEMIAKPHVWRSVRQMCISFHKQIYGTEPIDDILRRMAPRAEIIVDDQAPWPCHLFINRG